MNEFKGKWTEILTGRGLFWVDRNIRMIYWYDDWYDDELTINRLHVPVIFALPKNWIVA